jgi:hypothetical protein
MRAIMVALFGDTASPWRDFFLMTTLLCQWTMVSTVFAKDAPDVSVSNFDNYPRNLNYFPDSDVVMFIDQQAATIYRSVDGGAIWKQVDAVDKGQAYGLVMHQYDPNRAYVLTQGSTHWRTHDRGETWQTFSTDVETSIFRNDWLSFHARDPDRIMFNGMDCEGIFCDEVVMYTLDGFASDSKFLRGQTSGCWWAQSSTLFTTGQEDLDSQRILCIARGELSMFNGDDRLLISDNFFSASDAGGQVQEYEPNLDGVNRVQGSLSLAVVKKYLLVATNSKNTAEMALYVTDDTIKWHRAVFPSDHLINQEAYTVLESTNYSIQIDVLTSRPRNPMGVLLTSNSNGTYFTVNVEHTNRNWLGHVDFEKISGIQGIYLVNQVENWDDVESDSEATKNIKTKITFDDGRTFETVNAGDEEIHLHSVTEINNVGRVFSSPAPGLVMGNGNIGKYLGSYRDSNLYVSGDAGRTWIEGLKGPHKYEFGDQGSILLAVPDSETDDVSKLQYSLNHGQTWAFVELPNGLQVHPGLLTTTQDSTSLKFVLTASSGPDSSPKFHVVSIDFEGMHEDVCKDSDMEDWFARKDDDGSPSCLMGHTQKYHRRKKDAKCFVKSNFKDPIPESTPCDCSDADFECDFNFVKEDGECVRAGPVVVPEGACQKADPEETFMGSSGWRLIPGNDCKRKDDKQRDELKEWKCSDSTAAPGVPASGKISHQQTLIEGDFDLFDKHYLERGDSSSQDDETVIMRPTKASTGQVGSIMITQDHGKNWMTPTFWEDDEIWSIVTHPYFKEMVFFLTFDGKVYYTMDRGQHFDFFYAPTPPDLDSGIPSLFFHPDKKDWMIWHGLKCHGSSTNDCYREASLSKFRGDRWDTLRRYVSRCQFTGSSAYKNFRNASQIICLAKTEENNEVNNPLQLVYSDDFFENQEVAQEEVKDFATMDEFIVVATANRTQGQSTLNALASLDGRSYAPAHFPYNFEVPYQHAYTVLDSSTHAVNLFVETDTTETRRLGNIMKSNSNGTSYVLSISGVNCDDQYFVDFEKMLGLQGVAIVNIVANRDAISESKRLQSQISHNDGAEWSYLPPPKHGLDGERFSCSSDKGDESCALHIHGYTERVDHRKTYSSESAVGIMFGWGNVGPILGEAKDADTFMTTDAGISWEMVKKGRWNWSFGDQGSIIVLAQRETRTKIISYTLDEGKTWQDYTFSDSEVVINDITTLRSGASRNFLLWGHRGDELLTINIDFSGLTDQPCEFDEEDSVASDYALWTPSHPKQPNGCLFGHKSQYLRKKTDRACYNSQKLQHLYYVNNCTCTRSDFEW